MPDNSIMNAQSALIALALLVLVSWYLFPLPVGRALIAVDRRRNGVHSRYIQIDAAVWHYLEAGKKTPLLALHGIAADADHWTRLAGLLRRDFRVIAPDLPGFGCSSPPVDAAYTVDEQVDMLHGFVSALGLKDFYLAGNSMGGQLAAAYAARFPGQVCGLCLLAPSGIIGARFSPVMKAVVRDEHNPLLVRNGKDFDQLIEACFYSRPWIPWPVKKMTLERTLRLETNTRAAFEDMRFFSNSLEKIAASITVPCLILWGSHDQVLDVSGAAILDGILPQSSLVVLDKTGHLPMLEDPARCAGLIKQFTDGLHVAGNNSSS